MKRIVFVLIILNLILSGCASTPEQEIVRIVGTAETFGDAVQEIYQVVGEQFYSVDSKGKKLENTIIGAKEVKGNCIDYSIEFAHYWNDVYDYGEKFGECFIALHVTGLTVYNTRAYNPRDKRYVLKGLSRKMQLAYQASRPSPYSTHYSGFLGGPASNRRYFWNYIKYDGEVWGVDAQNADIGGRHNFPPYNGGKLKEYLNEF